MVYRPQEEEIDQGDLLEEVPFIEWHGTEMRLIRMLGMVTSHGCTCEKYTRERDSGQTDEQFLLGYTLHVAPVMAAERFPEDYVGNIRSGRVRQYFAIRPEGSIPELVVDLNQEQPIPAVSLLALNTKATLSEDSWLRFIAHRFTFQTRLQLADVLGRA